ncbi:MAG: flagellar hook basal-body protein [Desulfobacteraceae bacterium]|nr:flagellar hook basal-body protein [Desulfobacteraceae bacterium]
MGSGIYSALSGGLARMRQMEVAVNNLANAGNIGFKANNLSFESLIDSGLQNTRAGGKNFCRTADQFIDFSQGSIKQTGRSLDLAIQGDGFFKVAAEDGFFYTRQGNFRLDSQGNLVTADGKMQVIGENGPVNLPRSEVHIDSRGRISTDGEQVGKIDLYKVREEQSLIQRPDGVFEIQEDGAEVFAEDSELVQGGLEQANVSPIKLATELIETKRAYSAYLKTMKIYGDLGEKAVQIGRIG